MPKPKDAVKGNTCSVCAYTAEHGHVPTGTAHCRDCHRSWRGSSQVHCRARRSDGSLCCQHFAAYSTANLHWGSGKSVKSPSYSARHIDDPSEMGVLRQDDNGVWHQAGSRPGFLSERVSKATKPGPST